MYLFSAKPVISKKIKPVTVFVSCIHVHVGKIIYVTSTCKKAPKPFFMFGTRVSVLIILLDQLSRKLFIYIRTSYHEESCKKISFFSSLTSVNNLVKLYWPL